MPEPNIVIDVVIAQLEDLPARRMLSVWPAVRNATTPAEIDYWCALARVPASQGRPIAKTFLAVGICLPGGAILEVARQFSASATLNAIGVRPRPARRPDRP